VRADLSGSPIEESDDLLDELLDELFKEVLEEILEKFFDEFFKGIVDDIFEKDEVTPPTIDEVFLLLDPAPPLLPPPQETTKNTLLKTNKTHKQRSISGGTFFPMQALTGLSK
jgi:hypothetical protein